MSHPFIALLLRGFAAVAIAAGGANAQAAIYSANVSNASTSAPKLNAAGTAWEPFSTAQGDPNSGKSIKLLYLADDGSSAGYPLSAPVNAVKLRASTGGALLTCSASAVPPELSATNAGTCTYRFINTAGNNGDTLEIFYLGRLSGNIRLSIGALTPAVGGNTVQAFDSDTVLAGTPPSPTLSRKPARLVVAFDKSGSMAWSSKLDGDAGCGALYAPNANCRRWDVLRRASAQMVSVAKAYRITGDKLGVVFFSSDAENTAGLPAGSAAAITDMTGVTLDAIDAAIGARSPAGATSIGDGIGNLSTVLTGGDNANFNNAILLFTDGEQNTAQFVVDNGSKLLLNATNSPIGGTEVAPASAQLKLCPFKLRLDNPADPSSTTLLQTIADRSQCGAMNSSLTLDNPPVGAIQYFIQVLNTTLFGDKLELVQVRKGAQAAPAGALPPPLTLPFVTSKQDVAFTALLAWDRAFQAEGRPAIKLSKDGVDFIVGQDPNVRLGTGTDHVAMTMRPPFCNAARQCVKTDGPWTLTVGRTMPRGDGNWSLIVVGDNATLASEFSARQATAGIGQPLQLQAKLSEGGQALTGLAPGSVRAFVQAPAQSLGNVLSASNAKPGNQPDGDPGSAAGRKVQAMLADPAQRAAILAALELGAEQGIALSETSPGVYSANFPATVAEGIYRVSFRVEGTSAGNGAFTRVFDTDRYVPVQPDDAATARTMQITPFTPCDPRFAGGCKQITLKPVDAAGNLVGPGKAPGMAFFGTGAELVGTVEDRLDGSYTLVVGHVQASGTTPPLSVAGVTLNLPPAAGPGSAGASPLMRWWWVLLLILLVLIVVAWLMKRR